MVSMVTIRVGGAVVWVLPVSIDYHSTLVIETTGGCDGN